MEVGGIDGDFLSQARVDVRRSAGIGLYDLSMPWVG
jgi:hypothetical protein